LTLLLDLANDCNDRVWINAATLAAGDTGEGRGAPEGIVEALQRPAKALKYSADAHKRTLALG
jgi:hypothetical protein